MREGQHDWIRKALIIALFCFGGAWIFFWIFGLPIGMSYHPQFSEIYNQTYESQQDLFIHRWEDTKRMYLNESDYEVFDGDFVPVKVAKGTKIHIRKITKAYRWANIDVHILVDIKDPYFSKYSSIDAHELILQQPYRLGYIDDVLQFNPLYLKNIKDK